MAAKKSKPLYVQVEEHVLALINGQDFAPGDRVPSERMLAEQLGINRMTVRKAVDRLVERHILERNGTSGTRVPLPHVARPIDVRTSLGITRIIRDAGGKPGNRLLHFGEVRASENVAARLEVPVETELVMLRRLLTVNAVPFCVETTYLPADRFPNLIAQDLIAGQSLYSFLAEHYGVKPHAMDREISVGTPSDIESRMLQLGKGEVTFVLRLVARDKSSKPFEYTKSSNHPHHVVFRTSAADRKR